jgi:hypothetical protein
MKAEGKSRHQLETVFLLFTFEFDFCNSHRRMPSITVISSEKFNV